MRINWDDIRYRGDASDVEELFKTYRVGHYLEAFEQNRVEQEHGIRERLLKHGIRLTERISPRIYHLYDNVCTALGIGTGAEVFCLPDSSIQATAILDISEGGRYSLIGVTSGALQRLEDKELEAVLGHEIGHFRFGNHKLNALLIQSPQNPKVTVLPPMGESLFLRWRKKAEVSADRVGLLACGDFEAAARALLKATFGLDERNLNLDIDALLAQIDEIKGCPELMEEAFASHPLLPIRLKALELFSRSDKAKRNGFRVAGTALSDAELGDGVDEVIRFTRRYPHEPLRRALMRVIAMAGALLLGADTHINEEEIKVLLVALHHYFTDEPDKEIVTDGEDIRKRLPEEITIINEEGETDDKMFVLSRLADIALADGALMDPEAQVILEIAEHLQIPPPQAYAVMVGAVQTGGFRTDVKLDRVAEKLRASLQIGLRAASKDEQT